MHWGLSLVYGEESSDRALKTAHTEVLSKVLRTPISDLEDDLHESSQTVQEAPGTYIAGMQEHFTQLLPSPQDAVSAGHLNSVLVALSALEKNRKAATPSAS
jgi:hypothetical protein